MAIITNLSGWDQRAFDAALEAQSRATKRILPDFLNKKGYYIARKAIWFTRKADKYRMEVELARRISVNRIAKSSGKIVKKRVMILAKAKKHPEAPLAALIINARRGRKLEKGLWGKKMAKAINAMWGARRRSIGFIKSGWIEARAILRTKFKGAPAGLPTDDIAIKRVGTAKGGAAPAVESDNMNVSVRLWSTIESPRDVKGSIDKYKAAGLQRAFDDEAKSMILDLRQRLGPEWAKTNRALK